MLARRKGRPEKEPPRSGPRSIIDSIDGQLTTRHHAALQAHPRLPRQRRPSRLDAESGLLAMPCHHLRMAFHAWYSTHIMLYRYARRGEGTNTLPTSQQHKSRSGPNTDTASTGRRWRRKTPQTSDRAGHSGAQTSSWVGSDLHFFSGLLRSRVWSVSRRRQLCKLENIRGKIVGRSWTTTLEGQFRSERIAFTPTQ